MTSGMTCTLQGQSHRYLAAVVLGTALTTMGANGAVTVAVAHETASTNVPDISRYCTACWRNARLPGDCWADCTQEVFRRLLERVPADQWHRLLSMDTEEYRELVRAIDAVKKRVQRQRKTVPAPIDQMEDRRTTESPYADEWDDINRAAAELLSPRQQRILRLSRDGWSVHEMAAELRLPAERISDEKYKAVKKLRGRLASL